jgi:hypothetical protein
MKSFEAYRPSDWHDSGMIMRAPVATNTAGRTSPRRTSWRVLVAVPLLSFGVTVNSVSIRLQASSSVAPIRQISPEGEEISATHARPDDEVPADYWSKMIGFVQSRAPLPREDDLAEPDPLV